jgi:hypothetical protein
MKTFHFYHKNSSVRVTLSADNFEEAEETLFDYVKSTYGWRVEDEDGEAEEWDDDHM